MTYIYNVVHRVTEEDVAHMIGFGFKLGFFVGLPVGSAVAVLVQHFLSR